MTMTFSEYDNLIENFAKIKESVKIPCFYPRFEQIEEFYKDPDKWLKLACYLYEMGKAPTDSRERYSRKNLYRFINDNLELVDG